MVQPINPRGRESGGGMKGEVESSILSGSTTFHEGRPVGGPLCIEGTVRPKLVEVNKAVAWVYRMTKPNPFRYFKMSPEIIRLGVKTHVRFPRSPSGVSWARPEAGRVRGN